jgi:DNA modification methylase
MKNSSLMEVNSIYEGDNIEILNKFPSESVDLIYLDPPFFSNRHYEVIWEDGAELRAFQDRWQGGIEHYISWMNPRLRECHRILKKTGTIYLHCDTHANAHLRILLDIIFDDNMFLNEIIWNYGAKASQKYPAFQSKHDTILMYSKGKKFTFNKLFQEYSQATLAERATRFKFEDKEGKYRLTTRRDSTGKKYRAKVYLHEGVLMDDVWDIPIINATSKERLGYPTQKPVALLDRIVKSSSNEGDIVLDPFCGCGTTLVASQKLKRKWKGIKLDIPL